MEEYFLECGSIKLDIQNDTVMAMLKISEETPTASEESCSQSSTPVTEGMPN